jgi:predicted nucleic acid-binding protein
MTMNYLVDTNILLRLSDRNHPQHLIIRSIIRLLRSQEHDLYITPQNCAEFWNVATRTLPQNALGLDIEKTAQFLQLFERLFFVIPDNSNIYSEWKRLVKDFQVKGVQVHDSRLVAVMKTHGIYYILTFNVIDFKRYQSEGIKAISPQENTNNN